MPELNRMQPALGTYVDIFLTADVPESALVEASELAFNKIRTIHKKMSFHDSNSELSRLNTYAHIEPVTVSEDTCHVIKTALKLSHETDGCYDISVGTHMVRNGMLPEQGHGERSANWRAIKLSKNTVFFQEPLLLDLGGIAKGYAVDAAFEALLSLPIAFEQIIVNAGGDLRMLNWQNQQVRTMSRRRFWRTRHRDVQMKSPALATSQAAGGSTSSYAIDAKTGKKVNNSSTICVFSEQCMIADALTKVAALMPKPESILSLYSASMMKIENRLLPSFK